MLMFCVAGSSACMCDIDETFTVRLCDKRDSSITIMQLLIYYHDIHKIPMYGSNSPKHCCYKLILTVMCSLFIT